MSEQINPPGDPVAESDEFRRGYVAGYEARVQEEVRDYLRQIEVGRQVYDRTIRGLMNLPTIEELRAAREGTLREAHAAELHAGRPAFGCPVCVEAVAAVRYRVDRSGCPNEASSECCSEVGHCVMLRRNSESDRHHSGDYGVRPVDRIADEINKGLRDV